MVLSFSPCCPSLPLPHWPLHLCNVKPPTTAALPWEKPHNLFFKTKQCHLPSITADKEPSFISQTAHSLFAECVQCFFLEPLNSFSILWLVEKCMLLSFRPVYSILRRANPFYNRWSFLNVTLPDGYPESQGLSSFSQWTFSYLL